MGTAHYNFTELVGTNDIDIVSDVNTPLGQIDTAIYNAAQAASAAASAASSAASAAATADGKAVAAQTAANTAASAAQAAQTDATTALSKFPVSVANGGTGSTTAAGALAALGVLAAVYPVGSIYMTTEDRNPHDILGIGTWTKLPDRFLHQASASYAALATGGSNTHTHTLDAYVRGGFAAGGRLIASAEQSDIETISSYSILASDNEGAVESTSVAGNKVHGSAESGSNIPEFVAVWMWYRSA